MMEPGAVLRFEVPGRAPVDLRGPHYLLPNLRAIPNADARIQLVHETRRLFRVPGSDTSVASIVWVSAKNVLRAVHSLCGALSK